MGFPAWTGGTRTQEPGIQPRPAALPPKERRNDLSRTAISSLTRPAPTPSGVSGPVFICTPCQALQHQIPNPIPRAAPRGRGLGYLLLAAILAMTLRSNVDHLATNHRGWVEAKRHIVMPNLKLAPRPPCVLRVGGAEAILALVCDASEERSVEISAVVLCHFALTIF